MNYRLTPNGTDYTYYYPHNWRGDIVGIYTDAGDLTAKYTYDSWGNVTSITDGDGNAITSSTHIGNLNPLRYRGYYMDTETGMYYLMSRYYDPVTHRFLNADGYFQTGLGILDGNMNAYCKNNPIMYMDNNGDFAILISIAAAFEAAIVATTVALVAVLAISIVTNPSFQQSVSDAFSSVGSWSGSSTYTYESEAEKDIAPSLPSNRRNDKGGKIYYHVTTPERAVAIKAMGVMTGSGFEGGYVYAWKKYPNKYAVNNSGASFGVIISFKTNASFIEDMGIDDPKVTAFAPVVSTRPGPISVWDVQIIGETK